MPVQARVVCKMSNQLAGITRISSTVQWFREAAVQDSQRLQRITEEAALTLVYPGAFARWLYGDTPDSRATRGFLSRTLRRQQSCPACVITAREGDQEPGQSSDSRSMPVAKL